MFWLTKIIVSVNWSFFDTHNIRVKGKIKAWNIDIYRVLISVYNYAMDYFSPKFQPTQKRLQGQLLPQLLPQLLK